LPVPIRARLSAKRRTSLTLPNGVTLAYSYWEAQSAYIPLWNSQDLQVSVRIEINGFDRAGRRLFPAAAVGKGGA
jgi:hypothetical protein